MEFEPGHVISLVTAAFGGGVIVELVRRLIPSAEKTLEFQASREAQIAATEGNLRKALWDELDRTMKRVDELEIKLRQATEIIETLNRTNRALSDEIETLTRKLNTFTTKIEGITDET